MTNGPKLLLHVFTISNRPITALRWSAVKAAISNAERGATFIHCVQARAVKNMSKRASDDGIGIKDRQEAEGAWV